MMKSNTLRIAVLLLALLTLLSFASCSVNGGGGTSEPAGTTESPELTDEGSGGEGTTEAETLPAIWNDATHKKSKTFGEGEKTFTLDVVADGYTVTFTVKTNEEFVGAALLAHGLIAGEEGAYGLYIKTVNGMLADYDVDRTYWSITKNGEYLMTGADTTPVEDGASYALTRTKG